MRDKNRIPPILKEIEKIWMANPDLRLGQLIINAIRPENPCPDLFYVEDDVLLSRLLNFGQNETYAESHQPKPNWKKYPNISKIEPQEITIELVENFIHILKEESKIVITPIHLIRLNGAPVSDNNWLSSQKTSIKRIEKLLKALENKGILVEKTSKQDFSGIKEKGYHIN